MLSHSSIFLNAYRLLPSPESNEVSTAISMKSIIEKTLKPYATKTYEAVYFLELDLDWAIQYSFAGVTLLLRGS